MLLTVYTDSKNHLFWKIKFITKQKMREEVAEVVEETEEGVTDDDIKRMAFRKMYTSKFCNGSTRCKEELL